MYLFAINDYRVSWSSLLLITLYGIQTITQDILYWTTNTEKKQELGFFNEDIVFSMCDSYYKSLEEGH